MAKRWGGSKEEMEDEIKNSREEMEEQALSYWVCFNKLGWVSPICSSQFLDINNNIKVYYKFPQGSVLGPILLITYIIT